MRDYITDDVCEEVTICDPNEIIQDCLPEGEDLTCLYDIDLSVSGYKWYNWIGGYEKPVPVETLSAESFLNYYNAVEYLLKKIVYIDPNTSIQQTRWLAEADGGIYDDHISGVGLLNYINWASGNTGAVAQVFPSVYLGDLIHFDIDGGAGNDWIQGANNADILKGGTGNDTVLGEAGDDNISGGAGNDNLYGADGNDIIDGGLGNDYASGGNGDDDISGGGEFDVLGSDTLDGGAGNDNLYGWGGNDYLYGGEGNDWISGGAGNDYIEAGSGDDCADGGSGDDRMYMGSGDDRALGGTGNDYMYGGSGNDRLDGGDGDDHVYGEDGNDLVVGGAGDDCVSGGNGEDIIRGGLGDDELWGGQGCDIFAFCDVDFGCQDVIRDFSAGFEADQIDLSQLDIDSVRVQMTGYQDQVMLNLLADGDTVQQILVMSNQNANLQSVFDKDTAYAGDDGALVKIGAGVMVDLPSSSILIAGDQGIFF